MPDEKIPQSYYDILKIHPDSTDEDVKMAYRKLVKIYHPDVNKKKRRIAELRLRMLNEAYNSLKTHEDRLLYNRKLAQQKTRMVLKADNDNLSASEDNMGLWSAFTHIFWPRSKSTASHHAPSPANKER
jgi:curved DNA-binding protein CbpA